MPTRAFAAIILALLLAGTARAQEGVLQGLHGQGYAAFTFDRDTSGDFTTQGLGQEIGGDVTGAFYTPDFVSWSSSISYAHNTASLTGQAIGNSTIAGSFNAMVLPASSYPLTISYQRTRVGLGQAGFDSTTNNDQFSLEWRVNYGRLPKIAFRYGNDSSSSDVPVNTFFASDTHGSGLGIFANDTWKGWDWSVGWSRNLSSSSAFLVDRPATIELNYSELDGNLGRTYLGGKGAFNYRINRTSNENITGLLSDLNGTQFSQAASTSIRLNDKLTTFGAAQYYTFSSEGRVSSADDPEDSTYIVNYPTHGYNVTGGATYRVHPHVTIGDVASYSGAAVAPSTSEQASRYFTNFATVNGNYTWRGIVMNGTYGLGYTGLLTTTDRNLSGLTNNVTASASWARPWILLTGGVGVWHAADGPLPGSYENGKNYNITGESSRLGIGLLRARWALEDRDLLGFTGLVNSRRTFWSVTWIRRRWQVEAGKNGGSGAHQIFTSPAVPYEPLPELTGDLLIDAFTDNWYVNGSALVGRSLRITGTYRRDITHLPANDSASRYSVYEVRADYRIGRMLISGSYGRYMNMSAFGNIGSLHGSESGSSADRFRFRVLRTFNFF